MVDRSVEMKKAGPGAAALAGSPVVEGARSYPFILYTLLVIALAGAVIAVIIAIIAIGAQAIRIEGTQQFLARAGWQRK